MQDYDKKRMAIDIALKTILIDFSVIDQFDH